MFEWRILTLRYFILPEQHLELGGCITRIIHPTKILFYARKSYSTKEISEISRCDDCLLARRLQFDSQEIVRLLTLELLNYMAAWDFFVRNKATEGEVHHLPPSISEDKNAGNFCPISPYVFLASCFNISVNLNLRAPVNLPCSAQCGLFTTSELTRSIYKDPTRAAQ